MTSSRKQDDNNIQLIEMIQSPDVNNSRMIINLKKRNKIDSPIIQSPSASTSTDISNLFTIHSPTKSNSDINVKSPPLSYREKLKHRFQTIKKQTEISVIKQHSNKRRNSGNDQFVQNEEEINLNKKLNEYNLKSNNNDLSDYDFFCKCEETKPQEQLIDSSEHSFLIIGNDMDLVEILNPTFIDFETNEQEMFKEMKSLPIENVINENGLKRNFEEEGLMKANLPKLSKSDIRMLKNLIRMDEHRNWLNSDGELNILPDPRLDRLFKPFELNNIKETDFIEKYVRPVIHDELIETNSLFTNNILEIILHELHFNKHPLYSEEHILAEELITLYHQYKEICEKNLCLILNKKLAALRSVKRRLSTEKEEENGTNRNIFYKSINDIKNVRKQYYKESENERKLKHSILNNWKLLKQLRNRQQYSNTNLKLLIKKEYENTYEQVMIAWNKNIEDEISELIDEYKMELFLYREEVEKWKRAGKEGEKPKKPEKLPTNLENIVREKCEKCLKPPGEPLLYFQLEYTNNITKEVINDPKEKTRRNKIEKTKYYVKVLYNKHLICKSKSIQFIDHQFICNLNELISINLFKLPKSLNVEVYEKNEYNKHLLVKKLQLHVPDLIHTIENSEMKVEEILNDAIGVQGFISFNIGWAFETETNTKSTKIVKGRNWCGGDIGNVENLPDPQDPQNAFIIDCLQNVQISQEENYFRLDPGMKPLEFCTDAELENDNRLKLLKLRSRSLMNTIITKLESKQIVPNRLKEITPEYFDHYQHTTNEFLNNANTFECDNIDARRKWAEQYLKQVENKILYLRQTVKQQLTPEDVLNEQTIPTISSFSLTFLKWFEPKRPLHPIRKPLKKQTSAILNHEYKLIINVTGATQIPIRTTKSNTSTDLFVSETVKPYIVINFQNNLVQTTVAEGSNPIWNQDLVFTIRNINGMNSNDLIIFNLYDEIIEDLIDDDRMRDTNIHKQFRSNWLGRFEIPVTTLIYRNKIEGVFEMETPLALFGYEMQKPNIYLTCFITLQPALSGLRPQFVINELTSIEYEYVEQHIVRWQNQYNTLYPLRQFSSFVLNTSGERVCVTRYFHRIQLVLPQMTEYECVQYVSLIPFREMNIMDNIWLTPEQILDYNVGSIQDHAVLLTCYLMTLGMKCWLLLGFGIPYGYTAYVLIQEQSNTYNIYDVKTARKYNVRDDLCPLQRVYSITNDENVWANIQKEERIQTTRFDLTKTSDWLQLFDRNVSAPISNQHECYTNIISHEQLETSALMIQERIEKKLRRKLIKWRPYQRTIWNHYWNATIKQVLMKLQTIDTSTKNRVNIETIPELQSLFTNYQVHGFLIKMRYSSISDLINFLYETNIHRNEYRNVEYSMAVSVYSYFNGVFNIWLFVSTLVPLK